MRLGGGRRRLGALELASTSRVRLLALTTAVIAGDVQMAQHASEAVFEAELELGAAPSARCSAFNAQAAPGWW